MNLATRIARSLRYRAGRMADRLDPRRLVVQRMRGAFEEVDHKGHRLLIGAPNAMCRYRARTFSTKEPETLQWIDSFEPGAVFWDIGANIGLYSLYAASARKAQVYAFEPSVFNLEFLARNVSANQMVDRISIVPMAVGDRIGRGVMHMSSTEWGGALSTFDKSYGSDGKELKTVFDYATQSITMDAAVSNLNIPFPDYLKVDVDGIEHLVLAGGAQVLSRVKGVLIEISEGFRDQAVQSRAALEAAGLRLVERHRDPDAASMGAEVGTSNHIWSRVAA